MLADTNPKMRGYFNPRSREGSDIDFCQLPCYALISIRAPARGATSCKRVSHADRHISIRAPARGATESFDKVMAHNKFQSALPRGERPFAASFIALFIADFNPRSREGSDLWYDVHRPGERHFNPRSREGSDSNLLLNSSNALAFQSALPRGERLKWS